MKFRIFGILTATLLLLQSSCIENNIPYPVVKIDVLGIEGEGFTVGSNDIDAKNQTVTLRLDEKTDVSKVTITNVTITEGGTPSIPLTGTFDLRAALPFTLSLYQDYKWEILAVQEISRSFKVEGQIGETIFDLPTRTATARVPLTVDLTNIKVTELKLGPEEITTMDPAAGELTDFTSVRNVDISYHNFHERWRLYVEHSTELIALQQTDLWNNTATVTGIVTEEEYPKAELQYRVKGAEEWQATQKGALEAGIFSATIAPRWTTGANGTGIPVYTLDPSTGLFAGQTYEFRIVIDGEQKALSEFQTPTGDAIPDSDMENPGLSCFTSDNKDADFWGSGNNTFATGLCSQSTFTGVGGAKCAKLAGAAPVNLLAAGNLFSGIFYKADLTTGVVEFGQPYNWTARPTAMKVKYYAEKVGKVDVNKHTGAPIGMGDQDKSRIFVAIVDWSVRHKVTSGTAAPTGAWDPEQMNATPSGKIIAYGSVFIGSSSTGGQMIEATLPLNFYDQSAKPSGKYTIAISSSTSAYGDFMVGCKSNVLYVDDFQWVY